MLSEQKFKKYWDADSSYFTRDNVWQFFQPHLQQPFDREEYQELLRSLPHIIALNHVKELLDALEALHTGGSEICTCNDSDYRLVRRKADGLEYENCVDCLKPKNPVKPVCDTCGGSGKVYKHPKGCLCPLEPCPACKEVRYHRSGQGMHLDERGEQRRKGD